MDIKILSLRFKTVVKKQRLSIIYICRGILNQWVVSRSASLLLANQKRRSGHSHLSYLELPLHVHVYLFWILLLNYCTQKDKIVLERGNRGNVSNNLNGILVSPFSNVSKYFIMIFSLGEGGGGGGVVRAYGYNTYKNM